MLSINNIHNDTTLQHTCQTGLDSEVGFVIVIPHGAVSIGSREVGGHSAVCMIVGHLRGTGVGRVGLKSEGEKTQEAKREFRQRVSTDESYSTTVSLDGLSGH